MFAKDVVVDITCFRKYGHNELDEPSFTNPLMYKKIAERQSVPNLYKEKITTKGCLIESEVIDHDVNGFKSMLDEALNQVNKNSYEIQKRNTYLNKNWSHMNHPSETSVSEWSTGCDSELLKFIGNKSVTFPNDFVNLFLF